MEVNLKLIKSKICEKSITKVMLAEKLDIGRNSLYLKLSGKNKWQINEINKLSEILEVPANLLLESKEDTFRTVPKDVLKIWHDQLLDGNIKEVINSIAEFMYGAI